MNAVAITATLFLCDAFAFAATTLHAQSEPAVAPTFSVGATLFEFDERGPYRGVAVRAGVGVLAFADVVLLAEHWPDLGGLTGYSTQLEASLYPVGRQVITPRVILAAGRFWASRDEPAILSGPDGFATSFGLGVQARPWHGIALEFDGLLRFDAGTSGDAQLRALVGYTPKSLAQPLPRGGRVAVLVLGMVTVGGPWRFTERGYGVRFTTPVTERYAGSVGVTLVHWRIPHPTIPDAYTWDTRAVLINPGLQWTVGSRLGELRARAGPNLTMMFEGPDQGVRGGAQVEVGTTIRAGPVPLTAGVGWLWMSRHQISGGSTPGTDQHGLMLSAGIGY